MKKNALVELRSETALSLKEKVAKDKKDLANLYLELNTKKLKDVRKLFHKRKDISQTLTIINEKRIQK